MRSEKKLNYSDFSLKKDSKEMKASIEKIEKEMLSKKKMKF